MTPTLPPLEESRMGRVQAEADRTVAVPGVDLIERARHLLATGQLGRGEGHQQIAAPVLQQADIAKMHADADDRARSCGAPEAHPQGAAAARIGPISSGGGRKAGDGGRGPKGDARRISLSGEVQRAIVRLDQLLAHSHGYGGHTVIDTQLLLNTVYAEFHR